MPFLMRIVTSLCLVSFQYAERWLAVTEDLQQGTGDAGNILYDVLNHKEDGYMLGE